MSVFFTIRPPHPSFPFPKTNDPCTTGVCTFIPRRQTTEVNSFIPTAYPMVCGLFYRMKPFKVHVIDSSRHAQKSTCTRRKLHLEEKLKHSSPKNLFDLQLTDRAPTIHNGRPTDKYENRHLNLAEETSIVCRQSTDCRSTVGRPSAYKFFGELFFSFTHLTVNSPLIIQFVI